MEKTKSVVVIGAGVAGLASAIRLQKAGYDVEIYERDSNPGGKMNRIEKDGFTFDLGPTIVMMPELYREIFELAGRDPNDYIPMQKLDPMYAVFFSEQSQDHYEISSNLVELMKTLEDIDEKDAQGFLTYLEKIYKRFLVAKEHFLQKPFRNGKDFYNPKVLRQALKLRTLDSADSFIGKYIKNDKIKSMLSFQTLYIGVSPYTGPSLYTIIPMIEILYGVWFIKGGMHTMAKSMEKLFLELGGKINYNCDVQQILIKNGKAYGIQANNQVVHSDYVMCNADFPHAMKHLIQDQRTKGKKYTDKKIDQMKYSCSCFLMYIGLDKKVEQLDTVHNFYISQSLKRNIDDIFEGNQLNDPSFYVYIGSKLDETMAPKDKDGLYILVPVSELSTAKDEWTHETSQHYREQVMKKLSTMPGFEDIEEHIISETHITPMDFKHRFNAYNGACFGLRPNLTQSNHLRPQSKATYCENLYFTGSSTHPGAGVPIVLLSAKIASEELILDDEKAYEKI
ncbi:phytoene desaturase family protein [Cytobacillus sp. FSL W7-1323]|uniref:phytoene desaturase family protein n=1 Tax=Cytobacillus TaxID=2675230 RepID=UPI002782886D|nr:MULTISPECIES: phytoene desaturase family protein [Cytobacillus]MDQ0186224.1 phytoene desaturase [Cytobacillus kochii]MEA1855076.1 phytoene desaturase family protein [Cytobacillus sp. OWB-43]